MKTDELLRTYPIISDQVARDELSVILLSLERKLQSGARGGVVEFGCYIGTTSLFIRRLLDYYAPETPFHVYDSFAGLPTKTAYDQSPAGEQFVAGELAASKKDFLAQFKKAGLTPPVIHKMWFNDCTPADVPKDVFFAFLDGDYYDSIRDSLRCVTPRLTSDATIIVDDYASEALPGAAKATDEWLTRQPTKHFRTEASLGIIF